MYALSNTAAVSGKGEGLPKKFIATRELCKRLYRPSIAATLMALAMSVPTQSLKRSREESRMYEPDCCEIYTSLELWLTVPLLKHAQWKHVSHILSSYYGDRTNLAKN